MGQHASFCPQRGQPMQYKTPDRGWSNRLHLSRRGSRGADAGDVQCAQQFPQEQRIATGRGVAGPAELVGHPGAQLVPGPGHRGVQAQRPRVQRDRIRARGQLGPERTRLGLRRVAGRPASSMVTGRPSMRCIR